LAGNFGLKTYFSFRQELVSYDQKGQTKPQNGKDLLNLIKGQESFHE
jgi:hypothetical protein